MTATADRSPRLTKPKYRPDLDGLRAIAVLAVVGFHAFPDLITGGFIGVDIFFVISGFLISSIIFSNLEHENFSILEFYNRRIRRIFPALLVVMLVSLVFGWHALLATEYELLGKHIAGGAGFISNFLLWQESGYFDSAAETKPMLHLWSLAIEEQFYIFWPLLLAFTWKRQWSFLRLTALIFFASFSVGILYVGQNSTAAFYSPILRFWELMLGGVLAYFTLHKPTLMSDHNNAKSLLGITLLVAGLVLINRESAFPGWWATLPTLGAFFLIAAGPRAWMNQHLLSHSAMVWIGLISYPLYLWHWPILSFLRLYNNGTPSLADRVVGVIASVALAAGTYYLIERRVRHARWYWTPILLAALLAFVGSLGLLVYRQHGLPMRLPDTSAHLAQIRHWTYWRNSTCENLYPYKYNKDGWWFCMQSRNGIPSILLLGDSHANEIYAGLVNHPAFMGHTVLSLGTCGPEADPVPDMAVDKDNPCYGDRRLDQYYFLNGVINIIKPHFVIINNSWPTPDQYGHNDQLALYVKKIGKRVEQLGQLGAQVILILPRPKLRTNIINCYARPFREPSSDCRVSQERETAVFGEITHALTLLATQHKNLRVFDPFPLFCDGETCRFRDASGPFIRDAGVEHLSEYGSMYFASGLARWAESSIPEILAKPTPSLGQR